MPRYFRRADGADVSEAEATINGRMRDGYGSSLRDGEHVTFSMMFMDGRSAGTPTQARDAMQITDAQVITFADSAEGKYIIARERHRYEINRGHPTWGNRPAWQDNMADASLRQVLQQKAASKAMCDQAAADAKAGQAERQADLAMRKQATRDAWKASQDESHNGWRR
jgi:hypothetical protein